MLTCTLLIQFFSKLNLSKYLLDIIFYPFGGFCCIILLIASGFINFLACRKRNVHKVFKRMSSQRLKEIDFELTEDILETGIRPDFLYDWYSHVRIRRGVSILPSLLEELEEGYLIEEGI